MALMYFNTGLIENLGYKSIFTALGTIVLKTFGHLPISQKV